MKGPRHDLTALMRLTALADFVVPLAIRAAAELRIADHLAAPKTAAELARDTGTDAHALTRLMRCLVSKGIFAEPAPGRFALAPMAELLRAQHPLSLRDAFPLVPADLQAWAHADHSLRTGTSAFAFRHGRGYWEHMRGDPETSGRVDASVESSNRLVIRMFERLYEWDAIARIVDVGGGNGSFLAGLLARHPRMHGILFDQEHVVRDAARVLERAGVAARCEVVAGSFFDAIPTGADAYLLKTILHDWRDEEAMAILRGVRAAIPPAGRLLVIEALLAPGNEYDIGKLLDVNSLVLAGGEDRTATRYDALFQATGFRLQRVLPTSNALALIEAVPTDGAVLRSPETSSSA